MLSTFQLLVLFVGACSSFYLDPKRNLEIELQARGSQQFTGSCEYGYKAQPGIRKAFKKDCFHCGGGCCKNTNKRIAGGTEAAKSEFPWSAALFEQYDGSYQFFCGGVLIRPDVVLTAAHCVEKFSPESYEYEVDLEPGVLKVSVGELDIQINNAGKRERNIKSLIDVRQVQIYSEYRRDLTAGGRLVYDVALLMLEKKTSNPIACLDEQYDSGTRVNLTGHVCFGIGHGRIAGPNSPPSSKLRKVPVNLHDVGMCDSALRGHSDKYFCAKSKTGFTVGCKMDSGSPVVCRSDPNDDCSPYFISGIFSFRNRGDNCDGTHSVLSNMLDLNGMPYSAAAFVMESVDFALGVQRYHDLNCRS